MLQDTWLMGSLLIPAGSTPVIAPVSQNYIAGQNINPLFRWRVIKINGTVTTNNVTPTITSDGPAYQRFIVTNPDGTTEWQLGCPNGM
jgi:hypothetical protein